MDEITQDIAARVRAEMARHSKPHKDLIDLLGISVAGVSRRMTGKTDFDARELILIAEYLDIPVMSLIAEPASA